MRRRAPVSAFLVLPAIALLYLVTCSVEDEPTTTRPPVPEEPEAAERRARPPRQRTPRPAAPADRASPAEADRAVRLGDSRDRDVRLTGWASEWLPDEPDVAATLVPTAPPGTGRVRVLMLKDGRPFEGGHVCFFPEATFVEPGPWDGASSSDGAYMMGLPRYTALWQHFDPVLGSGAPVPGFEEVRGVTGADGYVTLDVPAGRSLVLFVRHAMSGIPLVSQPRVHLAAGQESSVTIEASRVRTVKGRCLDADGKPLGGILVQAIHPRQERPLSRTLATSAEGAFELAVFGEDPDVRIRAVGPHGALGIHDTEAEVSPIPAETTVSGVVPGEGSVDVWMPNAPLVFIELTVAEGDPPLGHLQIEGLVWDAVSSAWGRLGGPAYRRARGGTGGRRAVVALPRSEAVHPLMLWSWGWTITAADPRGADRLSVEIPRGRWAGVRGRGWHERDRLRVVAFCGPAGAEIPSIWIDGPLGKTDHWSRDDSPPAAIEFQILRDGVLVGRSARVPPGTGRAAEVRIDLE